MLIYGPFGSRTFLSGSRKNSGNIGLLKFWLVIFYKIFLTTFYLSFSHQQVFSTHHLNVIQNDLRSTASQNFWANKVDKRRFWLANIFDNLLVDPWPNFLFDCAVDFIPIQWIVEQVILLGWNFVDDAFDVFPLFFRTFCCFLFAALGFWRFCRTRIWCLTFAGYIFVVIWKKLDI